MSANVLRLTFTDKISASPISKSYQTNQSTLFPNFDFIPEIGGLSLVGPDRTSVGIHYAVFLPFGKNTRNPRMYRTYISKPPRTAVVPCRSEFVQQTCSPKMDKDVHF